MQLLEAEAIEGKTLHHLLDQVQATPVAANEFVPH